jgi:putative transposase
MASNTMSRRYATDLTDEQWEKIRGYVETDYRGPGRPRTLDVREVLNGIFYLTRTGCQWEMLPRDLPNHNSVRYYFDKWTRDGTLVAVNKALGEEVREKE